MEYKVGQTITAQTAAVRQSVTKPPENYTDGMLIALMTNIHRLVTDPKDSQVLKDSKGLGTERTRAAIIENLVRRNYLVREKGRLIATPEYRAILNAAQPSLKDPVMTAKWEMALGMIEAGQITLDQFMAKIEQHVRELTDYAKNLVLALPDEDSTGDGAIVCPKCQQGVLSLRSGKFGKFWGCSLYPNCKSTYPDKKGKPQLATL